MNIADLVSKLSELTIYEKRLITEEYGELVLVNTPALDKLLTDLLGPAVKKYREKPDEKIIKLTKQYGGIWINQALFRKDMGTHTLLVMLWPWGDEQHTTVKIASIKL